MVITAKPEEGYKEHWRSHANFDNVLILITDEARNGKTVFCKRLWEVIWLGNKSRLLGLNLLRAKDNRWEH